MAKQLNVNLAFTADTSKAKAQLQDLQRSLDSLMKGSANTANLPLTKELLEAQNAAASLKVALDSAINTQTGKLDITKFSGAMKTADLDATTLRKHLENLGPAGNQAFLSLTKSVMSAEMPIRRTNALVAEMWTTLKNTARWQISSSILHGFMGTVQSAYGYTQDLNESLNNIRIVTGQNTEEMARFADRANKAAKALSTTTTEYTNASLIYYQQGLSESEVEARTNITIKMANAAGVSAQTVSDQLTAVWNNFYDGSKSLEYYADVMTALGAATASSTDEISEGLNKFAAVAETVGLSYEYATSALATVTATTRESADVVGTAFKTLFARIQGLSLGETLEDGTDLNKYSEALNKVGINIKDTNGQMKDMDTILDELGSKWQTLGKDQQTALAQTVAGVRQYTQLVALMDNWDYFQENLEVAKGAEGALQEQANIYAESWEAARDRVTAAAEDLYDSILDDDFFITLLNGFEKAIGLVTNLVDSLGGLPGILSVVATLVTKIFSKQLETSIDNIVYGINSLSGANLKNSKETKEEYSKEAEKISFDDASDEGTAIGVGMQQQTALQKELLANEAKLSEAEKQRIQNLMDIHQLYVDQAAAAGKAADVARQVVQEQNREARAQVKRSDKKVDIQEFATARKQMSDLVKDGRKAQKAIEFLGDSFKKIKDSPKAFDKQVDLVQKRLNNIQNAMEKAGLQSGSAKLFKDLVQQYKDGAISAEQFSQELQKIAQSGEVVDDAVIAGAEAVKKLGDGSIFTNQQVDAMANAELELQNNTAQANGALNAQTQQANNIKVAIAGAKGAMDTFAQSVVKVMQGVSQIGMGISSIISIFDVLNNQDMSFGEKLLSITMSLSMAIPALISGLQVLNREQLKRIKADAVQIGQGAIALVQSGLRALGAWGEATANKGVTASLWEQVAAWVAVHIAALPVSVVILLIVAALGALVAISAGVIAAFNAISNAYNADAIAAENAATAAQNLAEAYGEVKQEYEDMISAMENYHSARDALDDLTKGTEEYQEALKEANHQAMKLINQYGLIEGQDYDWQDDEIVIKDEALSRTKSMKEKELDTAYAASQMADAQAKETRAIADQTKLSRQIRDDSGIGNGDQIWKGALDIAAGLAVDILSGGMSGGMGTLAAVASVSNREAESAKYDEAIEKAIEESKTNANLFDTKKAMAEALDINLNDTELIDALWANRDSIQQLSADINAADQAEKLAAQNAANEIMSESGYDKTEAGKMALEAGGEIYQQMYGDAYDKHLADAKNRGLFNTGTDASKAAFEEYAKQSGLDQLKNFKVTNYKGDGTVEYKYIDEDGNEQVKLATAEEIAATLAAADAAKQLEGALSSLRSTISELNKSEDLGDHALADFLSTGNLEGATKAEFDDLKNDVATKGIDNVLGLTGDETADNALAKERGYADAQAYREAFTEALNIEWKIPEGIGENIADSLSVGAANSISNTFEELGAEGGQAFIDTINTIASGADWDKLAPEDQTAMLNEIANIDWSSWDAGEQAIDIAERYGIAIDQTSQEWQNSIQKMRDASNALPDLSNITTQFKEIKSLANDIELGGVISEEDYNKLIDYNSALKDYFTILSDGTAQFIGDQLDFQQAIEENGMQQLLDGISTHVDRLNEINAQLEAGANAIGGIENLDSYRDSEVFVGDDGKNYYNEVNTDTQLAFLESQNFDTEQIKTWKEELSDGSAPIQTLEDIAAAVDEVANSYNGLSDEADSISNTIQTAMNEIALEVNSASERFNLLNKNVINTKAYAQAAQAAINKEKWGDFDTKEVADYAKHLRNMAKDSDLLSDSLADNQEAAEDVALYVKKMNQGIQKLSEGFEEWSDILKNSDESSEEYCDALTSMKDAVSDLLGTSEEFVSNDFLKEHLEDLEKAAIGDAEAIDRLKIALAEDIICQITAVDNFEDINSDIQNLHDQIVGFDATIDVGTTLRTDDFTEAAQGIIDTAGMTVEQAQAYFNSLGYEPEFVTEEKTVKRSIPQETTHTDYAITKGSINILGQDFPIPTIDRITTTRVTGYEELDEVIQVPALSANGTPEIKSLTKISKGSLNNSSGSNKGGKKSGGGGGGGSKSSPAKPSKKKDVVQRYATVENKLEEVREEADKLRASMDNLYGEELEAAMERLIELENEEKALLEEKRLLTEEYAKEDLADLQKAAKDVNVKFTFDKEGNIENYEEEMEKLYEELSAMEKAAGDEWDESEQKQIDALNEKIATLQEAIDAYEETLGILDDINAEYDEMAGKPALPYVESDYLDIYYEVIDALDDVEEAITDAQRELEGLVGQDRIDKLKEIEVLEERRLELLKEQHEIAVVDAKDRKDALDFMAMQNGVKFEYDDNGNITNYLEEMRKLEDEYEQRLEEYSVGGITDAEQEALDALEQNMEELKQYVDDYREAIEQAEDIENEIQDAAQGSVADPFVRSDHINIYKQTEDQLDDIDEKIDDLQRQADRLTGEERIAKLKEIQKLEKERLKVLEQQADIARQDRDDRQKAMEEIAARNDLMFQYDENGNITNYIEQLDKLVDKYEEAYNEALADDGLINETEQAILDAIEEDIDHLEEYIDAYCEAVETMEDIENERQEIAEGGYVDMDQLDEIGDKLHDINNALDDIEEAINDSSKAADRLYGEARIRQMNKTTQLIEKEIDALEKKKALQKDIIAEEKAELDKASGGSIRYDSNGNISNYHDVIDARKDAIRAAEDAAKADGDFTEAEAEEIQEMIDELERLVEELEEYEDALEDLEDIENAIDDAFYEWQDLNAEKLSYKLELTLDVNDRELAKIERQIQRLDGNFYSRAEALALMIGGGLGGSSQIGQLNSQLGDLEAHYNEVKRAYEAGEISHAAYVEQTKEIQAELENTADAMADLQDQMETYYKDTLAAARQELNFYTAQMEHLTSVLGHFKNILTSLGKSQDYEMMDTVLRGQVETLENEVQVQKKAMQMWKQEADEAYASYQSALASGNQETANMYYLAYQEALNAANEAENKYYQKAQQWAEALKALMQNTLSGLAQDLENSLTGGTSFDYINTQLKRASSLQEEYLTTTNKIYETTKMMRTAQNEIDKTTNSVAKRKLANFITETKQMQNQNKLSKYELSIQQAKYDLLLAEIALEEARFAKSTVRLQRDAEGNFGYVYTADAEAVANAEQKFEDASNKLYNIGLEGANKYTEKYQQTLSEMYDTLTALQNKYLQGGFESEEEYNAAVTAAKEYYYEKLAQYSELYSIALTTDSRVVADAWSTDFADMTQKTEDWMNAVDGYLVQVRSAFAEWEAESDRIANETVGTNLTDLKNKVGEIVSESENLVGTISNSVIPAIQAEINEVQKLTDAYAAMAGSIQNAIDRALDLSDALQQDIDASVENEIAKQEQEENQGTTPESEPESTPEFESEPTPEPESTPELEPEQTPESKPTPKPEIESEPEPTHSHSYKEVSKEEPTCQTEGKIVSQCSCGETKTSTTAKVDHKYKDGKCIWCGKEDPNHKGYGPHTKEGVALAIWNGNHGWGTGSTRTSRLKEMLFDATEIQNLVNSSELSKAAQTNAWTKKYPEVSKAGLEKFSYQNVKKNYWGQGFDTGGYTGQWGSYGKLAWLHEKELVLNKDDTENFLTSLELLDGILSTIDLYAMNSQFNPSLNSPYIPNLGKETLEQNVTIEASFPNAADKQEIEDAFKDLINLASQYANRK